MLIDPVWNFVLTNSLGEEGRLLAPNPEYPGDEFALLVYESIKYIVPTMIPGFRSEAPTASSYEPMSVDGLPGWMAGGLTQLAIRLRRAGQPDNGSVETPAATANDARDKWLYQQCCKLTKYSTVIEKLAHKAKWEPISNHQGIKTAAGRYATAHNLPPIPGRQPGRPRAKK